MLNKVKIIKSVETLWYSLYLRLGLRENVVITSIFSSVEQVFLLIMNVELKTNIITLMNIQYILITT